MTISAPLGLSDVETESDSGTEHSVVPPPYSAAQLPQLRGEFLAQRQRLRPIPIFGGSHTILRDSLAYLYTADCDQAATFEFLYSDSHVPLLGPASAQPSRTDGLAQRDIDTGDGGKQDQLELLERLRNDLVFMWRSKLYADVLIMLDSPSAGSADTSTTGHRSSSMSSAATTVSTLSLPMDMEDEHDEMLTFSAHRFILASRSGYFAERLLSPSSSVGPIAPGEATTILRLPPHPFSSAALHFTLGFLYTGSLTFSNRHFDMATALQMFHAACFLNIPSLAPLVAGLVSEMFCHKFACSTPLTSRPNSVKTASLERFTACSTPTGRRVRLPASGPDAETRHGPCTRCLRRVPRVFSFTYAAEQCAYCARAQASASYTHVHLEGSTTTGAEACQTHLSLLRLAAEAAVTGPWFGAYWTKDIGNLPTAVRTRLVRRVTDRVRNEPEAVIQTVSQLNLLSNRLVQASALLAPPGARQRRTVWIEHVHWMTESVEATVQDVLASQLGRVVAAEEWQVLLAAQDTKSHETLDKLLVLLLDGISEMTAPVAFQVLARLSGKDTAQPAQNERLQGVRGGIVRYLRRRWRGAAERNAFAPLEPWAKKEIARALRVTVDDLDPPIPEPEPEELPRSSPASRHAVSQTPSSRLRTAPSLLRSSRPGSRSSAYSVSPSTPASPRTSGRGSSATPPSNPGSRAGSPQPPKNSRRSSRSFAQPTLQPRTSSRPTPSRLSSRRPNAGVGGAAGDLAARATPTTVRSLSGLGAQIPAAYRLPARSSSASSTASNATSCRSPSLASTTSSATASSAATAASSVRVPGPSATPSPHGSLQSLPSFSPRTSSKRLDKKLPSPTTTGHTATVKTRMSASRSSLSSHATKSRGSGSNGTLEAHNVASAGVSVPSPRSSILESTSGDEEVTPTANRVRSWFPRTSGKRTPRMVRQKRSGAEMESSDEDQPDEVTPTATRVRRSPLQTHPRSQVSLASSFEETESESGSDTALASKPLRRGGSPTPLRSQRNPPRPGPSLGPAKVSSRPKIDSPLTPGRREVHRKDKLVRSASTSKKASPPNAGLAAKEEHTSPAHSNLTPKKGCSTSLRAGPTSLPGTGGTVLNQGIPCVVAPSTASPHRVPPVVRLKASVKYLGPVTGQPGTWVGVELFVPVPRTLRTWALTMDARTPERRPARVLLTPDGSWQGKSYFHLGTGAEPTPSPQIKAPPSAQERMSATTAARAARDARVQRLLVSSNRAGTGSRTRPAAVAPKRVLTHGALFVRPEDVLYVDTL